jgi:hypothetical protein
MIDRILTCCCNFYWSFYKSQIPSPYGCRDTGMVFFKCLPFIGKLLYLLRPLMIRPRRKKIVITQQERKIKSDPVSIKLRRTQKIYYSLITNSLHKVLDKDKSHELHMSQSIPTNMMISVDGTSISSFQEDHEDIDQWYKGEHITYLFTFNLCCFPEPDHLELPPSLRRSLSVQNAGGQSELSETMSMYYMYLWLHATNFVLEMDVSYRDRSSLCDYVMDLPHGTVVTNDQESLHVERVGVSVTRALTYPTNQEVTKESMMSLIQKKMIRLLHAQRYVLSCHSFERCVIHIWCQSWTDAQRVRDAYQSLMEQDYYGLYERVYVICSICPNHYIYTNSTS